jgi:hypothetical protein
MKIVGRLEKRWSLIYHEFLNAWLRELIGSRSKTINKF